MGSYLITEHLYADMWPKSWLLRYGLQNLQEVKRQYWDKIDDGEVYPTLQPTRKQSWHSN